MITLVPVDSVDGIWPHVAEGLQAALLRTGGDLTPGELWQGCRAGSFFMLVACTEAGIIAASVWQPQIWQTGRKLRCLSLYGRDFRKWIEPMHQSASDLARNAGCTALVAEGRGGWTRIFRKASALRVLYEEPL